MNVIVCGAGDVGRQLAEVLTGQGHGVTMIDSSAEPLRKFDELIDIRSSNLRNGSARAATRLHCFFEPPDQLQLIFAHCDSP